MKFDIFWVLLIVALWLLFFRKPRTEKYCGACMSAMG